MGNSPTKCASIDLRLQQYHGIQRHQAMNNEAKLEFDSFLATKTAELSYQHRLAAQADLFGVEINSPEDDQQAIRIKLIELDTKLSSIKKGTVYEVAEFMNKQYVSNTDFRMMFLRAARYDPYEAANKVLKFLDMKQKLFGTEKLVKDITLGDLDDDDKEILQSGWLQILSNRDKNGRQIHLVIQGLRKPKDLRNEMRASYYMLMSLLESESNQRNGITFIGYAIGQFKDRPESHGYLALGNLLFSIPIHIASTHNCCDDPIQNKALLVSTFIMRSLPTSLMARMRVHYGSHMECQYSLATYGISHGTLPLSPNNNYKAVLDFHWLWFIARQQKDFIASQSLEPAKANSSTMVPPQLQQLTPCNGTANPLTSQQHVTIPSRDRCEGVLLRNDVPSATESFPSSSIQTDGATLISKPLDNDVLFGHHHKHPGNRKMQELCQSLIGQYNSVDKKEKVQLTHSVVVSLKENHGSRFLKFDSAVKGWKCASYNEAHAKVAHAFRNLRQSMSKRRKRSN